MLRRALFSGTPQLRGFGSRVFQSTPSPLAKCPLSSGVSEPQLKPVTASTADVLYCPVLGATPQLRCPIETEHCVKALPPQQLVAQMGKFRLSAFVTATTVVGYVICGGSNPVVASALTVGTLLQCCSANTANQIIEVEHDKKMKRTCRRPLPMGYISRQGASALCGAELLLGSGILCLVSPPVSALGILNWILYVAVYTPLKRVSAVNTWVGSIVGGIPPLMGGVAATGTLTAPAWLLGSLLVAWQIPHFMGLSFHCRRDYEVAGYKMLAFYNPWRASFYAVLLSVVMAALTMTWPALIGTRAEGWYYPITAVVNAIMIYKAWLFHSDPKRHCRGCFVFSYIYLSVILVTLMLNHFEPVKGCIAGCQYVSALIHADSEKLKVGAVEEGALSAVARVV